MAKYELLNSYAQGNQMKLFYYSWMTVLLTSLINNVQAQASFNGQDFSGVYSCSGEDSHEGQYKGSVSMKLLPQHSTGEYAAYTFELSLPGYGKYPGHAAGYKNNLAIYFAHTQHSKNQDFGTGIATFTQNPKGKWSFHKYYYEPMFKGGNHGFETCTQN